MEVGILQHVSAASAKRRFYLVHGLRQMARPNRMIGTHEVRAVIEYGELVEGYPSDPRRHRCLILGFGGEGRPIHVLCSPKDEHLAIITASLRTSENGSRTSRSGGHYEVYSLPRQDGRTSAPFHVDRDGCHVVLDNVPAWVCQQCGEAYFEEREVDVIQELIRSVEQNAKKIAAPG